MALSLVAGFSFAGAETEESKVVDRIVAIVNDDIVTLSEVNKVYEPYAEKIRTYGYLPEKEKEMLFGARTEIINQLIEKKLADQEIKKAGIVVSESELDSGVERIKKKNFWTDEELQETLARDGLTLEKYRLQMKKQIQRARLVDLKVKSKIIITKEDIKTYFEEHKEEYSGTVKYHFRNIIMKISEYDDEDTKKKIHSRLETIHDRLKNGESFEELARLYSESSLAAEGGDLGLFQLHELSSQIREAVKDLSVGGFTYIISTDKGYQIFYIEDIVTSPGKTLEKASPEIEEELYNKMLNNTLKSWIEELKKDSHIKTIL